MTRAGRHVTRVLTAIFMWGLLLVGAPVAVAAPGELDQSFASGGVFTAPFQSAFPGDREQLAAVDSQGRIVLAATRVDAQRHEHLDVVRLSSQGALDTSFNPGGVTPGVVEVDFSSEAAFPAGADVEARGVAIGAGDSVIAAGVANPASANEAALGLVRLTSAGAYDSTFDSDGRLVSGQLGGLVTPFAEALAVDGSGRIVVGGLDGNCVPIGRCQKSGWVARFAASGALDTAGFAAGGSSPGLLTLGGAGTTVFGLAVAPGSKLLAAGGVDDSDNAIVARINDDGTLDQTFGSGPTPGVVSTGLGHQPDPSGSATAYGVTTAPGGLVYVSGQAHDGAGNSMRVLRLTSAGVPDGGFGSGSPAPGVVAVPGGVRGYSVAVDGSGCPVVAGYGTNPASATGGAEAVIARLTSAGGLDSSFDPSGSTPGTSAIPLGDSSFGETIAFSGANPVIGGFRFRRADNDSAPIVLRLQGGGDCRPILRPPVATGQATNVSSTGATLNGTVNPNGSQVSDCHFDYGTTTNYGSSIPCAQAPGTGTSAVAVSAPISGLTPNTTYDYRLVATGPGGTSSGDNQTFTTLSPPAATTVGTTQFWGTTSGSSITIPAGATGERDGAKITGPNTTELFLGTVTFRLYRQAPSGPQCTGNPVFSSPDRPAIPTAESAPVNTTLPPGTYYWTATYTGDTANLPSASPCGTETLIVAPLRISRYGALISTQALTLNMSCTAPLCRVRTTITLPTPLLARDARPNGKNKPPVITLARGAATIRKHGPQTVRLRLTAAGRRFVASHNGRVTVQVAVTMTIQGHTRVINQRLTIRIVKPGKR